MLFKSLVEPAQFQPIQTKNLYKLYRQLSSLRFESRREILAKAEFCNRNLKDIGYSLANKLNDHHQYYDRTFVCSFGIFMQLVSIRYFTSFKSLLQHSFYQNLAPIFKDTVKLLQTNKYNGKGQQAKMTLLTFMKAIHDLGNQSITLHRKIYNKRLVDVLSQFQLIDDQTVISTYCLLVIQANQKDVLYNKRLIQKIFILLKKPQFTTNNISRSYTIICNHMPQIIPNFEQTDIILSNLKRKLEKKLEIDNFSCLGKIISLVIKISQLKSKQAFNWQQLYNYCHLAKNSTIPQNRILYMKQIAYYILNFEQKNQINNIGKLNMLLNCEPGLQVLLISFPKISSVRLISLMETQLLSKLRNLILDHSQTTKSRSYAKKLLCSIPLPLKYINQMLYNQVMQYIEDVNMLIQGQTKIQSQFQPDKSRFQSKNQKIFFFF